MTHIQDVTKEHAWRKIGNSMKNSRCDERWLHLCERTKDAVCTHALSFFPSDTRSWLLVAKERLNSGIQRIHFKSMLGFTQTAVILHESAVSELLLMLAKQYWYLSIWSLWREHLNPDFSLKNTSKANYVITSEGWPQCFGVFTAKLWREGGREGGKIERLDYVGYLRVVVSVSLPHLL